eukprot:scaffold18905_cov129-Isochrysis_galbana.AAC.4
MHVAGSPLDGGKRGESRREPPSVLADQGAARGEPEGCAVRVRGGRRWEAGGGRGRKDTGGREKRHPGQGRTVRRRCLSLAPSS